MLWQGASGILLSEYFDNKLLLSEKKSKLSYINGKVGYEDVCEKLKSEIEDIESKIIEFISGLNSMQLKSIIYMSLDMGIK